MGQTEPNKKCKRNGTINRAIPAHNCTCMLMHTFPRNIATWTEPETLKLIELWSKDNVQSQFEGCKRNRAVFESVSRRMTDAGFERTANQCREKIMKLRVEYKKVKDNNNQTGNNRKTCKFYEKLDNVLGSKPATRPPIVIDSFESSSGNNSCDSQKSDDDESASNNEQILDLSTEKSEEKSPPSGLSSDQTDEHHDKKPLAKKKRS